MKKGYYILASLMIFVFFSNIPPLRYLFDWIVDETHYEYANASGSFYVIDRVGNNISGVKAGFKKSMEQENLLNKDTVLFRLFWKNPLAFWRYYSYFDKNDERYKLTYMNKDQIEERMKNITYNLKNKVN
ncbi:hypothetical protein [Sphingobacterium sp. MYb388]|uniref:hypothetical protein n=1 Tax=Sphingobacterium sp. MYb388 TaxID=2745437 RepID=UPI0030A641DB